MHIKAYIYLLIKRSLFPFSLLYMAGTAGVLRVKKSCGGMLMTTCKAFSCSHSRPKASRLKSPFRSKFLTQIKHFIPNRYWHCKTNYYWQKSRIIEYQLPRFIQPLGMVLSGPSKARSTGSECLRLLVDTSNCLPDPFNFLTPHMRFQSSSHTDVTVLKTQPSKERIKQ